jgi:YVTN family beta-propeller protein
MRVVRVLCVMAVFAVAVLEMSCGDTFRPIAIPQNPQPPDPKDLHFALVLTANGPETCVVDSDPPTLPGGGACDKSIHVGSSSRIDVSGDTNVGSALVGLNPVHAVTLPGSDTAYVANLADNTITAYSSISPGPATTTITLPPGTNPVFVETKESGTVYAAGIGNGSTTGPTVSVIAVAQNTVTRTLTTSDGIGNNPTAMVETGDGKKLYVVNRGSDTVTAITTVDKSNTVIAVGSNPIWAVVRADNARVYILNQSDSTVSTIDTLSDAVVGTTPVGAANYMAYDNTLNRVYLTVPGTSHLNVLDVAADPPAVLPDIDLSTACPPGTCKLDAVTTLPGGSNTASRKGTIYVSSHIINETTCTQLAGAPADIPPCITTQVSVITAPNNVVEKTIIPLHTVFVNSQAVGTKSDVPVVPFCDENSLAPVHARFRRHIAASRDATRVFIANCDAGGTDIIRTSDDTFVLNLPAPTSAAPALPGQDFPPPQNPVFVLPDTKNIQ